MNERLTPDELARAVELRAELYADTADNNTAPISDDELTRRFTDRNGDRFRYCATLGRWYEWRATHWMHDETMTVYDAARYSCKVDLGNALGRSPKDGEARALRTKLGSASTIAAVVKMASARPTNTPLRSLRPDRRMDLAVNPVAGFGREAIVVLEFVATMAFALSGVIGALRKRMDIVGICACGFLAAFGGGTLRDVLLDRRPFFWVEHQTVLLGVLAISVAGATFVSRRRLERGQRWLQAPDAIGLGLFCATGTHLSYLMDQPPIVAVMMGVITGTFGGVLRDLVCNEVPELFSDHRPYALCAAAGALIYVIAAGLGTEAWVAMAACAVATIGLRALALRFDVRLPPVGRA